MRTSALLWMATTLWLAGFSPNHSLNAAQTRTARPMTREPERFHGLVESASRNGWRWTEDTQRGNVWLSERTVFRDSVTGCVAWRMTCDPAVDVNDYYDIPGWNADGSLLTFFTRRTGPRVRWIMDANGDNLRPMPVEIGTVENGYWSIVYPDRFYHAVVDRDKTLVVATNPFTGKSQVIVSVPQNLGSMMPPHPSEKWFLFGDRKEGPGVASNAYVVGIDGTVRRVPLENRWHRLRFTKSPDARIFFNFDDPRTQWTILPDGSDRTSIPDPGGHPDWLPGGKELTYYTGGEIRAVRYDGTGKRRVARLESGGHGGPCLDGEWFVSDTPRSGKYPGSVLCLKTDGSGEVHELFKHMSSYYSHTTLWHPDHHTTHPHPCPSPDGTKVLFNSDFLGQYTDVYVVVARPPDPPQNVSAVVKDGQVTLTWQPPRRNRETRGYLVYRSEQDAAEFRRLTDRPVEALEWRGPAGNRPGCYVVTAVEHSGLEGMPSTGAFEQGSRPEGEPRKFVILTDLPETPSAPTVEPIRPNALRLRWKASPAADLDHYNVYSGKEEAFACDQKTLVGSPSATEMVDWGLPLGATVWYRLTAVDRTGNESSPSLAVRAGLPAFDPVKISLAPGQAKVENMSVEKDKTAGGAILSAVAGARGAAASWEFEVPRNGQFALWGRSIHQNGKPVGFEVFVDGRKLTSWRVFGPWNKWVWSPAGVMVTGSPERFPLSAGKHTMQLRSRGQNARLAKLVITDDPSWFPVEGMRKQ